MDKLITIVDANGKIQVVTAQELTRAVMNNFTSVFGMSTDSILAFSRIYHERGGKMPITPTSILESIHFDYLRGLYNDQRRNI